LSPALAATGPGAFWRRRFLDPLLELAGQQMRPETLALSIALGLVFGVFPIWGVPTLLCILAALTLRLNLGVLQLVNYLVCPLQLTLLLPFFRLGAQMFRSRAGSFSPAQFFELLRHDLAGAAAGMGTTALHAAAAWFCVCAPAGLMLYVGLNWALQRAGQGQR
jgi:uncharacterized protein (DUF2062 family)